LSETLLRNLRGCSSLIAVFLPAPTPVSPARQFQPPASSSFHRYCHRECARFLRTLATIPAMLRRGHLNRTQPKIIKQGVEQRAASSYEKSTSYDSGIIENFELSKQARELGFILTPLPR
jgi:hypothetical protein